MKLRLLAFVVLFALVGAACGDDTESSDDTASDDPPTESTAAADGEDAVEDAEPAPIAEVDIDLGDDTLDVLATYTIGESDTISPDAPEEHIATFERFKTIIPAELRPEVTHFVAISQEGSDGTDGAMQNPHDADGRSIVTENYIALDTTGESEALDRTIVHEFAHLLTLREGQVTPLTEEELESGDDAECDIYATPACPADDSYLRDYFTEFPDFSEDAEFDPDVYPTEYAATIPTEDVAEMFAEWVISDGDPHSIDDEGDVREVNEGTELDMKYDFFDDYPELVEAREQIRTGLGV